jgi:hypothetical protein
VIAVPASFVQRWLPPPVHAEDFSGSLWHGSAGKVLVNSHEAGAIEWRIHPWALLSRTLSIDLHCVKVGFVADAAVDIDAQGATARNVSGGGPIEDLADLGLAAGWRGNARLSFSRLKLGFVRGLDGGDAMAIQAAIGELEVSDLASPQIAAGSSLGGYVLRLADGAITPDADATAELSDTGGPLQLNAAIHYSFKDHLGLLSGTVKERPQASEALRRQLETLTQMHARDAQGRIPVELEFTL